MEGNNVKQPQKFKESFWGTMVVIVITALVTGLFTFIFNFWLSNSEYQKDIRIKQIECVEDLAKATTKIEQLREKIYWNKYFATLHSLIDDSNGVSEYNQLETKYRVEYEDYVSDYYASFTVSGILFSLGKDEVMNIQNEIIRLLPFDFDSDSIKMEYQRLENEGKTGDELLNELEEYAKEGFSEEYYHASMRYIYSLQDIIN